MRKEELICINCPLGCSLSIDIDEDGEVLSVFGNNCPRGELYAREEITFPTRVVTSTVRLEDGNISRVPVKTALPIPKGKIFEVMKRIKEITLKAPVKIGDIVIDNIADTGVPLVVTRNIEKA